MCSAVTPVLVLSCAWDHVAVLTLAACLASAPCPPLPPAGPVLHLSCTTAADGECQREELMLAGGHRIVTIDGFEDVPPYNELALKKAVSK